MQETEKDLRDLLLSQGELVGSVAHDLKGLITGIDGGIYLVSSGRKKGNQERIDQGNEMMRRNLERIRRTVSSILYYVKDRQINSQEIEIQEILSSMAQALKDRADAFGVTLTVHSVEERCQADPLAVQSILVNVVDYALEACHQKKMKSASIAVNASGTPEGGAVFEVRAHGFGMEEETRALALAEYYRPKGADRSHLGLFVANKIIKSHGGHFDITASPDPPNTLFSIKVPGAGAAG